MKEKSPIELALEEQLMRGLEHIWSQRPELTDKIVLLPQYEWNHYCIDFAISVFDDLIFVECDGHDYHERTKEQARHDRMKDRTIQTAGIPILRFTGSEIYRDAEACAVEIIDFARNRLSPTV